MQTLYHGDSTREHHFFVYPKDKPLVDSRWDTHDPKDLCDSFALVSGNQGGLQVYKCKGHLHQNCNVNVTSGVVALRSNANNKFVCADNNGAKPLSATRDAAAGWETFELVVVNGDNVALKSKANNQFVSIGNDGKNLLVANHAEVGPTETFRIVHRGIGKIALIAPNGQYVCAENAGKGELVANRAKAAGWETFDLVWK